MMLYVYFNFLVVIKIINFNQIFMNNNLINKISYNINYIDSIEDFISKVKLKKLFHIN